MGLRECEEGLKSEILGEGFKFHKQVVFGDLLNKQEIFYNQMKQCEITEQSLPIH